MSQAQRTVNHCDICNHEWIPKPGVTYTHCTSGKCRSRKWNSLMSGEYGKSLAAQAVSILLEKFPHLDVERMSGTPSDAEDYSELPLCGKDWWEDGGHYECLMDSGHREVKHGQRGLVRKLED